MRTLQGTRLLSSDNNIFRNIMRPSFARTLLLALAALPMLAACDRFPQRAKTAFSVSSRATTQVTLISLVVMI